MGIGPDGRRFDARPEHSATHEIIMLENKLAALAGQSRFANALLLLARIGMSIEFVLFGGMKIVNNANMQAYMETHGVPGQLIWLVVIIQLLGGACVIVGFQTRTAAALLGGFCLVATGIFHSNFADMREVSDFTKDLATAGGFALLFLRGPGNYSFDALRSQFHQKGSGSGG